MPSERDLLMIPGPIAFDPAVLRAMATPTPSHLSPILREAFGKCLEQIREIFLGSGQPFIIAGTGSLAMEFSVCNIVEPGDHVLICDAGHFGHRYFDILSRLGAQVDQIKVDIGDTISPQKVEEKLEERDYKAIAVTQVDTSTAILNPIKEIGKRVANFDTLLVVDGVCSAAAEETRFDDWNIDVFYTASQKAIGVPPGLALLMFSENAIKAHQTRKSVVSSYYCDIKNWLPIMKAYEAREPAYFGTPAVNLILALDVSTKQIVEEGMEACFKRHEKLSDAFKAGIRSLGLSMVPLSDEKSAHTMTAPYYPEGLDGNLFRTKMQENGIVVAGGLLAEIKTKYFRVGHMGRVNSSDILSTIGAIEQSLIACGYSIDAGSGLVGVQKVLTQ